jgi:hypothetical protein
MYAIDYDVFYAIASEGGLAGNCVISDTSALLIMALLANETPETLFKNADGSQLSQAQIEQARDTLDTAITEIADTS